MKIKKIKGTNKMTKIENYNSTGEESVVESILEEVESSSQKDPEHD